MPTGPVPARIVARLPATGVARTIFSTAAAAVVFEPFGSAITETRTGPKKASVPPSSICSPRDTEEPPMKTALFFRAVAAPREHGPIHQVPHVRYRHPTIANDMIRTCIVGGDGIE